MAELIHATLRRRCRVRQSAYTGLVVVDARSHTRIKRGRPSHNIFASHAHSKMVYPVELTAYNSGTVASGAVIAFLGAKKRKASASATFMLHRTMGTAQATPAG